MMKKTIIYSLIMIMLFNLVPLKINIGTIFAHADGGNMGEEDKMEFYEPSYYNYLLSNNYDGKMARSEIKIDVKQYVKSDDMDVSIDNDGISMGDHGTITWEFDVTEPGFYNIQVLYLPIKGTNSDIERKMYIDGKELFNGMEQIIFKRLWDNGKIIDNNGNEIRPIAEEIPEWQTIYIGDSQKRSIEPYAFYFTAGKHSISFESIKEPLKIGGIILKAAPKLQPYSEVIKQWKEKYPVYNGQNIVCQAERIDGHTVGIKKSSPSIIVTSDYSSPNTVPYHPYKIKLNTIGGDSWKTVGDFIIWEVEVPEEGLYQLSFRGRQNSNRGIKSYRELRINGEIPFKEAADISFEFSGTFRNYVCGNENGPYLFHLNKGKNTISLEVVLGDFGGPLTEVEQSLYELNELYRKVVQITGVVPDKYIDYEIDKKIPELREKLKQESQRLYKVVDELTNITGEKGEKTAIIEKMALQAAELSKKPEDIVTQLSSFKGNISALGTWIISISEMPLEIDSLTLFGENAKLQKPEPNFFVKAYYEFIRFASTFFIDDTKLFANGQIGKDAVKVWISSGRDQVQIIRNLIDSTYSPKSGIPVNLQLIPDGVVLPATLAGRGPDVVLNLSQSLVTNYAARNALVNLREFNDFDEQSKVFYPSALESVTFNGGVYGLPEQQTFMMMFYRNDILEQLGLKPPRTWDELRKIIPVLQRNNYDVYLSGSSLYSSLVFQYGGDMYKGKGNDYGIESGLSEDNAMVAFEKLTEFFTSYKLPVTADFANRFRTGEIPLGIAPYTTYNQLAIFAPEIKGLWSFAPVPGVIDSSGKLNNTVVADTTDCVIMRSAKNKANAWDFIKWWLNKDTQLEYANMLEATMGAGARYATANKEVLVQLPWPKDQVEQLLLQFESTKGVPEVPGGYMTGRMIDYAFKEVVTNGQNPREALYLNIKDINKELTKKRKEFHLSYIK